MEKKENKDSNSIYKEKGYANRNAYLRALAEEYDVDLSLVYELAVTLGPSEDFDGLIFYLEEIAEYGI